jgi:GTP-binding protein
MILDFRKTDFWGVAAEISSCPPSDRPEVVLSGKSNVGKSTLLNALADNKKLARVSQSPGKTRLVIYFDVNGAFYFADLPGYGYAKAPKNVKAKFSKLVDQYFSSGRKISLVLHLLDVRNEPSKEDLNMLNYMNQQKIPYFLVFTKCDKLSRQQLNNRLSEMSDFLDIQDQAICFAVSAEKKQGLDDLKTAITEFLFPD